MITINHRINTCKQLIEVPITNGIEVDVRYHRNELILHHDPFQHHENLSERLEDLLAHWKHQGPLILNIKTEGIELKCIELMNQYEINQWFFLDLSMPYFVKFSQLAKNQSLKGFGPQNLAVRFSEEEPIEYAIHFKEKAAWVWVDCFSKLPLNSKEYRLLKSAKFKICIVSPELQGHPLDKIQEFKQQLLQFPVDAVCTKESSLWEGL